MFIQGSVRSKRNERLVQQYVELIKSGVCPSKILVLLQNSYKKNLFLEKVKECKELSCLEKPEIHTFFSLSYRAICENWAKIETSIDSGKSRVRPELCGLEVSQTFMKEAYKDAGFEDYNSKINLLHQLFRRFSLIVQNDLTPDEVKTRSVILKETFACEAQKALDSFRKKTFDFRAFDYLRQWSVFMWVCENTDYFKEIEYLILDDADEMTGAQFQFIKLLKPCLKQVFIGYDKFGSSRIGFLNADLLGVQRLKELFSNEVDDLDDLPFEPPEIEHKSQITRLAMINDASKYIETLLESDVKPCEIAIVTPLCDKSLRFCLNERFGSCALQFISGSEKLSETVLVKNTLTVLRLSEFDEPVDIFDLRLLLSGFFKIPLKYCMGIISAYKKTGHINFSLPEDGVYCEKLMQFKNLLKKFKTGKFSLYDMALIVFREFFTNDFAEELEAFNFFLKQLYDFEKIFQREDKEFKKGLLNQLENTIISENPPNAPEIENNKILVSTAQKLIDLGIKKKHLILLDAFSNEWVKQDTGTLYNSIVFQKNWDKKEFTFEQCAEFFEDKNKRVLRKLLLSAKNCCAFSSLYDVKGIENTGGIEAYFSSFEKKESIDYKFTPREDQKPVLAYEKGHTAISAVPGAGKTTVLLALVIKLLAKKVNPAHIFVLTYMDSAARNFKERIKKICPNLISLPNISTIHGLALRILKENSNYTKAGLDADFEVCDDSLREKIIRELLHKMNFEQEEFEKYEKALSALKLSCPKKLLPPKTLEQKKFISFFNYYEKTLKNRNMIDYDDMLLSSVSILEQNPDIRAFYSSACEYIIEDEAQDSSFLQQRLLALLSEKHGNLLRCGDSNQSITTTFANADTKGFQDFVKNSESVVMTSSQRCAKEIFESANKLIDFSKQSEYLKNAFSDIKMKEVKGKNPVSKNALVIRVFEDFNPELEFIRQELKKIFKQNSSASCAILVRNNFQCAQYEKFLLDCGFSVITRSDCLENQPIFKVVFALLKFCAHPWDNSFVIDVMNTFYAARVMKFSCEDFEYVKNLTDPFILAESDKLLSKGLLELYWDLNYWLENSVHSADQFVLKAGNYYFSTELEKANLHLICAIITRLVSEYKNGFLEKLEELSKRPSPYKLFADEKKQEKENSGVIKIMTCHKSKGDEFDYVFLPELCEELFALCPENIKIKPELRFIEHIKSLNPLFKPKNENELKQMQIEENLRLIYVALTRAEKRLFVTCSKKYKKFLRVKSFKPSLLFEEFFKSSDGVL